MSSEPTEADLDDAIEAAHYRIATTLAEDCGVPPQLAPRIAFLVLRDLCQDPEALESINKIIQLGAGSPETNPPMPPLPRLSIRPGGNRARREGSRHG